MLEMVKNRIERTIEFLKDEKIENKRAYSFLNGYLNALKDFSLITFEEVTKILSDFGFENSEDSKEEE